MRKNKYNIGQEVVMDGHHYFIISFREIFGTYQYSMSNERSGGFAFACGEFSIDYAVDPEENNHEENISTPDLSFLLPSKEPEFDAAAAHSNTVSAVMRAPIDGRDIGLSDEMARLVGSSLFFRPDIEFVEWIIEYANGRQIIDVGAGQGHLVRMIKKFGGRAIGIEPNFDQQRYISFGRERWGSDFDINEMLPWTVESARGFINKFKGNALLIFARPCHSNFVYTGLRNMPDEMEALYITVPENFHEYDDLGPFKESAKKIAHRGESEDGEVVYSIKKK